MPPASVADSGNPFPTFRSLLPADVSTRRRLLPVTDSNDAASSAVNLDIAEQFREAASLLEAQEASPFRVRAYRQAASTLTHLDKSVDSVYENGGQENLEDLPNIGSALARAIVEIVDTGEWRFLDRLQGIIRPESVFQQVGGIGPELAARIHETLDIETLEELEQAAHDGRLADVEGFGDKRIQTVKESLEGRLRRRRTTGGDVPVDKLLDVDREYRDKAERDELRTIAPRRFNPSGEAWLPILHTSRDGRRYTALYSNTAQAHDLDKTHDWVVIYLENGRQDQWTVVTETSGFLEGKRVVRGREADCRRYYEEREEGER